MDTTYLVTDKI